MPPRRNRQGGGERLPAPLTVAARKAGREPPSYLSIRHLLIPSSDGHWRHHRIRLWNHPGDGASEVRIALPSSRDPDRDVGDRPPVWLSLPNAQAGTKLPARNLWSIVQAPGQRPAPAAAGTALFCAAFGSVDSFDYQASKQKKEITDGSPTGPAACRRKAERMFPVCRHFPARPGFNK
jgi:hypothetical protein